jgi:ubiquitin-activating enzyme E1
MQWARELLFEGHFVKDAEVTNNYLDSDTFLEKLSPTMVSSTYDTLHATLVKRPKTFDECIVWARGVFEDRFSHAFKQLLYNFPREYVDQQGVPFWSGAKRAPTPISFDPSNDLHLSFIVSASFLLAYVCGIFPRENKPEDLQAQIDHIRSYSGSIKVAEFVPKQNIKIETDMKVTKAAESSFTDADEQRVFEIKKVLPKREAAQRLRMHPVTFEKDDDTNFHIDFIHAASNLRAAAYGIKTVDRLKSKLIAGKIIPAIVTTTALVVGFVNLELYKIHTGTKKLEDYRNTFANLAIPIFQQGEPIKPKEKKYLDKTFTLWDRIDVEIGDATLAQLIDYFQVKHNLTLDMLGVGQSLLYASWSGAKAAERKNRKITELYEEITKTPLDRSHVKFLMLEPTMSDSAGVDVADLPQIAFWFNKKR